MRIFLLASVLLMGISGAGAQAKSQFIDLFDPGDTEGMDPYAELICGQEFNYYDNASITSRIAGSVKPGQKYRILAATHDLQEDMDGIRLKAEAAFFLIKTEDDPDLWSGWGRATDIHDTGDKPVKLISAGYFIISPDGNHICLNKGGDQVRELEIRDRQGNLANSYNIEPVLSLYGIKNGWNWYSPEVWMLDGRGCWYVIGQDEFTAAFICLPPDKTRKVIVIKYLGSHEYAINPWSGDIAYTDFPFQFDTETASATRSAGTPFTLSVQKFPSGKIVHVAINPGSGFRPRWVSASILEFRNSNGIVVHQKID